MQRIGSGKLSFDKEFQFIGSATQKKIDKIENSLSSYETMRVQYQQGNVSYLLKNQLRRFSLECNFLNQYSVIARCPELVKLPLHREIITISQQLMFTEVEAAYWVLITLRIENSPKESKFWVLILTLTALITKREMNDEETFTVYQGFFTHNYGDIIKELESFERSDRTLSLPVSLPDLNRSFRSLSIFESSIDIECQGMNDYNYVVDSLEEEHQRRSVLTTTFDSDVNRLHHKYKSDQNRQIFSPKKTKHIKKSSTKNRHQKGNKSPTFGNTSDQHETQSQQQPQFQQQPLLVQSFNMVNPSFQIMQQPSVDNMQRGPSYGDLANILRNGSLARNDIYQILAQKQQSSSSPHKKQDTSPFTASTLNFLGKSQTGSSNANLYNLPDFGDNNSNIMKLFNSRPGSHEKSPLSSFVRGGLQPAAAQPKEQDK